MSGQCVDCGTQITPTLLPAFCEQCALLAEQIYPGGAEARLHVLEQEGTK